MTKNIFAFVAIFITLSSILSLKDLPKSNSKVTVKSEILDAKFAEKIKVIEDDHHAHIARKAAKDSAKTDEHKKALEDFKLADKQKVIDNSAWKQKQKDTTKSDKSFLKDKKSISFIQSAITYTDSPDSFFDYAYETNINNLPSSATTPIYSWSASYWPIMNGIISVRYSHDFKDSVGIYSTSARGYTTLYNWYNSVSFYSQPYEHNNYYGTTSFQNYVNNYYSASEKYDFAMGDYSYTLTNALKNYGSRFSDANGNVASWMGICHGWTPASFYYPKPTYAVSIMAADGVTQVTFLPDDLRALTSLFWANASYKTDFVGTPCSNCQNVNPGSLILTFGNHIGIAGKNLIFDPSDDSEIWNQPIRSYSIVWYNLITSYSYTTADGAKTSLSSMINSNDWFAQSAAQNAAQGTVYCVGAAITLTYVFEIQNTHSTTDSQQDNLTTKTFLASIDLDANDNIIGGQWKYDLHPNFIWQPDTSVLPQGVSDAYVTANWCDSPACLKSFTPYAVQASKKSQVLKSFVDWLAPYSAAN